MKRGVFDLLRRGFDNALANWQVSLLRFLEAFLFIAIAIGAAVLIVVPILVSLGISAGNIESPEQIEGILQTLLTKWTMLLWILLGVFFLLLVFTLVHSFLEAGTARVFIDGDRVAGPENLGTRSRFRVFSFERWLAGAKDGWWTVFWIYNLIWGVALLILLIPLIPTVLAMFLLRDSEAGLVLSGCLGLIATMMLMLLVSMVAAVWSNRAIVDWAVRRGTAVESVEAGWDAVKSDLGRHVLTALAIVVVSFAGSMFFSSLSFFASLGELAGQNQTAVLAMTMPLRIFVWLINSAFSAVLTSWFVATYAAIATDPYR